MVKRYCKILSGVDITMIHRIKSCSEMIQDGERIEGEEIQALR